MTPPCARPRSSTTARATSATATARRSGTRMRCGASNGMSACGRKSASSSATWRRARSGASRPRSRASGSRASSTGLGEGGHDHEAAHLQRRPRAPAVRAWPIDRRAALGRLAMGAAHNQERQGEGDQTAAPSAQPETQRALERSVHLGSYADAVAAVAAGNADGIGYMLKDSNIGAIDLDHCVDQESTKLEPWAEQLCGEANGAYQEITVSGGGLRIIGTASGPETHRRFNFDRRAAGIELYRNTARYITISGWQIGQCAELPPLDAFIDMLFARHSGQAAGGLDFNDAEPQASPDYDDLIQNGAPEGERSELFQ